MSEYVQCSVDDLVVGRTISNSINDTNGVLLLASGQDLTDRVIERLKARGISSVLASLEDLSSGPTDSSPAAEPPDLRSLLETSGRLRAKDVLRERGRSSYDESAVRQFSERRRRNALQVSSVFDEASASDDGDGSAIAEVSLSQFESLQSDLHAAVASAFEVSAASDVAEQAVATAALGMAAGIEMDLGVEEVRTLGIAACFSSIGLCRVDPAVRNARRELTLSEQLDMHKVPARSFDMLAKVRNVPDVVRLVAFQVCERPDGSGYPRGLSGDRIHPFARILRVADDYNSAVQGRHRDRAELPYEAMAGLVHSVSRRRLDAPAVRGHLHTLSLFPIGSLVELSDGRRARVVRSNRAEYASPIVAVLRDAEGRTVDDSTDEHLVDLTDSHATITRALANVN